MRTTSFSFIVYFISKLSFRFNSNFSLIRSVLSNVAVRTNPKESTNRRFEVILIFQYIDLKIPIFKI